MDLGASANALRVLKIPPLKHASATSNVCFVPRATPSLRSQQFEAVKQNEDIN